MVKQLRDWKVINNPVWLNISSLLSKYDVVERKNELEGHLFSVKFYREPNVTYRWFISKS